MPEAAVYKSESNAKLLTIIIRDSMFVENYF